MITAVPLCQWSEALGLLGGPGPLVSISTGLLYWACQVSEKNLRAETSLQTGLCGWPGAVRKDRCKAGAWVSPPTRTGSPTLAPDPLLSWTPRGVCRMSLWFRIDTATFVFWHKCSVQHICVCVSLGDREKHCWIEKSGLVLSALSCTICDHSK